MSIVSRKAPTLTPGFPPSDPTYSIILREVTVWLTAAQSPVVIHEDLLSLLEVNHYGEDAVLAEYEVLSQPGEIPLYGAIGTVSISEQDLDGSLVPLLRLEPDDFHRINMRVETRDERGRGVGYTVRIAGRGVRD